MYRGVVVGIRDVLVLAMVNGDDSARLLCFANKYSFMVGPNKSIIL